MVTVGTTYSSPFGGTQQGANQQNFMDILKTITGGAQQPMSPQVAQSGYQSALSSKLAMNEAQAPFMAQAEQSLTEQSGIPQLQGQSADLSKLFEMYLADTGLAGKYSATPTNPYAGGAVNPYMGTPEQTVAAVTPTDTGAPGGGFTTPGMVTQAIGAPVNAAKSLIDLVNQAIGVQQGRVKSKMGDVSTSYQKSLDTLGTLASVFGDAYKEAKADARERAKGQKRETAFNKDGDLVYMDTGEIVMKYGDKSPISPYLLEKKYLTSTAAKDLKSRVNKKTVGWGAVMSIMPESEALNFSADLDSLLSSISSSELTAMREASKTGGAIGQVSNYEQGLLQNSLGAVKNRFQEPEQYKANLQKVIDSVTRWEKVQNGEPLEKIYPELFGKSGKKQSETTNDPLGIR